MENNIIELPDKVFVTGIGTGVGKTMVSAYLCRNYQFDYWKPIQAGDLDNSDSMAIKKLSPDTIIWPEKYRLTQPMSPHAAALIDEISINLNDFTLPANNKILVEGAGGLMVPINEDKLIIDLIMYLNIPVVLVVRDYLGCINHTLLSLEILKTRGLSLATVIFNGNFPAATLSYLKAAVKDTKIMHLPEMDPII